MSENNNTQKVEQVVVPPNCPQCPEGGYELISGSRRQLLIEKLSDIINLFNKKGEVEDLLNGLYNVVVKGLDPSEFNNTVISNYSGNFSIDCEETTGKDNETRIKIIVTDNDKKYVVEVKKSHISPNKTFEFVGCPLIGKEDKPGCNPETCPCIIEARAKTAIKI